MSEVNRQSVKDALRTRMLALEAEELAAAQEHYNSYLQDARIGGGEQHDTGDYAEAAEALDLAASFDHPVMAHQAKIDVLENLDFGVTDTVGPGAVVSFGGRNFVVAVSTAAFDCAGVRYMGISESAPIYKAMAGLQEGDSFLFHGREVELDAVF